MTAPAGPIGAELAGIDFAYGPMPVLFGLSFQIVPGEILGLLGTNGSGKSTALRVLCGLNHPSGGRVILDGNDVTGLPAESLVERGITLVEGGHAIFDDLTVMENLEIGTYSLRHNRQLCRERIDEALTLTPLLRDRAGDAAGSLSGGQQQQLALAKALLVRPRLLCIDELSLGLAPSVVLSLLSTLHEINARGTTLVLVEQSLKVAADICDRAIFLEKGEVSFEGPPGELLERGDIARSVFVRDLPQGAAR